MSTSSTEPYILLQSQSPAELRAQIRLGALRKQTSGLAPAYVQGNVAILPSDLAADFHRFCFSNPKPCPLLAVSEIGNPHLPRLGADLDIRTDVPRYRVFREGEIVDEPYDIRGYWRDDLVTFVIGRCFLSSRRCWRMVSASGTSSRAAMCLCIAPISKPPRPECFRSDGRLDAPHESRRCHPGDSDHIAIPRRSRGSGSYWRSETHRYSRSCKARLRRRGGNPCG